MSSNDETMQQYNMVLGKFEFKMKIKKLPPIEYRPSRFPAVTHTLVPKFKQKNLLQKLAALGEVFSLDKANNSPTKFNLFKIRVTKNVVLPPTHKYPFLCVYL
jgi:hypothetical protein